MRIPIKDLRELARKRGLSHVIVFGYDDEKKQNVATYGRTVVQCGQAADFGNKLKKALGWPDSLQAQPSRVRLLQGENRRLNERIRALEEELKEERG